MSKTIFTYDQILPLIRLEVRHYDDMSSETKKETLICKMVDFFLDIQKNCEILDDHNYGTEYFDGFYEECEEIAYAIDFGEYSKDLESIQFDFILMRKVKNISESALDRVFGRI